MCRRGRGLHVRLPCGHDGHPPPPGAVFVQCISPRAPPEVDVAGLPSGSSGQTGEDNSIHVPHWSRRRPPPSGADRRAGGVRTYNIEATIPVPTNPCWWDGGGPTTRETFRASTRMKVSGLCSLCLCQFEWRRKDCQVSLQIPPAQQGTH